ncbi:MAG: DUF5615 family PIN-like protein [Propionibacteriaceae bacterium]|jgi:predicted nuclease of predicted toxin-antitoxin system|nr:DUF5615 family PIN-like protein [Propionibacteriaceae bacterium]
MRLLLDNNLSVRLPGLLAELGWVAEHVRDLGLAAAPDTAVLEAARLRRAVLVSADTDFGELLARTHAAAPSVVLLRRLGGRRAEDMAALLTANLQGPVRDDLEAGAIIVLGPDRLRVRRLPLW